MTDEDDDRDLKRLVDAVCDGSSVDWDTESSERPHLRPMIGDLRLIESLLAARGPAAGLRGHAPAGADTARRWGPLVLIEKLEQGGFGEVHRAFDPALEREVALKLPRLDRVSGMAAEHFVEEARRLARVRHPNVLTVHGVDRHDGRVGVWTDLVRGVTLEALISDRGPLGAREAAGIGVDLCRALAAVHAAGLVHRDVKPSNVMREEGGRIVLMDFGAGAEAGAPGAFPAGTLLTMAPEQLSGDDIGPAADLYSLGVVLYRLVTGRFPIVAADRAELRIKQARRESVPLGDLRPDLPGDFVRVVERALEPDPRRRFPTAGAMARALLEAGAAPSASGSAAARRGRARNLWIAAGVALVVAVLAGVLLIRARGSAPWAAAPAVAALHADAALMLERDAHAIPLTTGDHVEPGDGLFLRFEAREPLQVYVLDEDAAGSVFVLFPAPGLDQANPLAAGSSHRLPGTRRGQVLDWQVTSAGGSETITVIAARRPLHALERDISRFPPAQPDRPVRYGELDDRTLGTPRGIGGLASSEVVGGRRPSRLALLIRRILADPRGSGGAWVWRIDLDNPGS